MAVIKNVIFDIQARTTGAEKSLSNLETRLESLEAETKQLTKDSALYIESLRKMETANERLGRNIDSSTKRFSNLDSTILRARQSFTQLAAVAGVGIAFQDITGTIIDFDQSLADLSAITGATGGDLQFYEEQARKIGKTTTVSASEAVEAFKLLGSAKPELLQSKEALVDLTNQAIILSEASGLELPIAAEQLGLSLNAMEIDARDAGKVVDALALSAKFGTREIPFVAEALSKFGAIAKNAGVSINTSASAIQILGKAVPEASVAGTNLRAILIKLQDSAAKNGREFKGLVEELELLKPRLNDVTFLTETFGQENFLAAQTLIGNVDALRQFETKLNTSGAAADIAATRTNTLRGDVSRLKNAWDEAIISFSNTGAIRGVIQFLTRSLPTILKFVLLLAKAWVAYKTGVIASTVAMRVYNFVQQATASGLVRVGTAFKIAEFAAKGFKAVLTTIVGGVILGGIFKLIEATGLLGDQIEKVSLKSQLLLKAQEQQQKQRDIQQQNIKNQLDSIDKANAEQLSLLESGSKEAVDLEKKINEEKLGVLNKFIGEKNAIIKKDQEQIVTGVEGQLSDVEKNAIAKAVTAGGAKDAEAIRRETERLTQEQIAQNRKAAKVAEADIIATQKELQELNDLALDLTVTRNQSAKDELKSKKELAAGRKEDAKQQREADKVAKEGTIEALQQRVSNLRRTLTEELRLDAPEFANVVEQYISAQNDLTEANKRLDESQSSFNLNTLEGLEKQLSSLKSQLQKAAIGDSEDFFGTNRLILEVEKKIKAARKLLEEEDKRAVLDANLERESEEERHLSVMTDLNNDANITDLENIERNEQARIKLIQDGEVRQLEIRIKYAQEKLKLLLESGEASENEIIEAEHAITEAQQELANKRSEFDQKDKEKKLEVQRQIVDGIKEIYSELFNFTNQLVQNQIDLLDKQAQAQQGRIDDARRIAEDGNAELLELEEKRLDDLNNKRANFVKVQQGLAALEVALNSAVAISKAATLPPPFNILAIGATLIALAAGLAQARSIAQQASFEKGGYTGAGNPKSESTALGRKPYTYHKGEFVMDAKTTAIGRNRPIFDQILRGRVDMQKVLSGNNNYSVNMRGELGSKEIVKAIHGIPQVSYHLNKNGVFIVTKKKQNYIQKVNNKR